MSLDPRSVEAADPRARQAGTNSEVSRRLEDLERARARSVVEGLVTVLPSSPTDGQIVNYLASSSPDSVTDVVWRLRYRAAAPGPYKWEHIGGPPLVSSSRPSQSITTAAAGGSGVWFNPTPRVALTLPLGGDYVIDTSAGVLQDGASTDVYLGLRLGPTDDTLVNCPVVTSNGGQWGSPRLVATPLGLAGGSLIIQRFQVTGSFATFYRRAGVMALTPIRVG